MQFSCPLLQLLTLVECDTRAVLATAFGPETAGETAYAERLPDQVSRGMLVLLDTVLDGWPPLRSSSAQPGSSSCGGPVPDVFR
ncbi:hypothetical protein [Streptomyces sp. NPDC003996]